LAPRQREVLEFLIAYITERGYPPTRREIASELGVNHAQSVKDHLSHLAHKTYVEWDRQVARSLRVLRDPEGSPVTLTFIRASEP